MDCDAKNAADRNAKEEADRKAKEEPEQKAKEEAVRIAKEEADRKGTDAVDDAARGDAWKKVHSKPQKADPDTTDDVDRPSQAEADCRRIPADADRRPASNVGHETNDFARCKAVADRSYQSPAVPSPAQTDVIRYPADEGLSHGAESLPRPDASGDTIQAHDVDPLRDLCSTEQLRRSAVTAEANVRSLQIFALWRLTIGEANELQMQMQLQVRRQRQRDAVMQAERQQRALIGEEAEFEQARLRHDLKGSHVAVVRELRRKEAAMAAAAVQTRPVSARVRRIPPRPTTASRSRSPAPPSPAAVEEVFNGQRPLRKDRYFMALERHEANLISLCQRLRERRDLLTDCQLETEAAYAIASREADNHGAPAAWLPFADGVPLPSGAVAANVITVVRPSHSAGPRRGGHAATSTVGFPSRGRDEAGAREQGWSSGHPLEPAAKGTKNPPSAFVVAADPRVSAATPLKDLPPRARLSMYATPTPTPPSSRRPHSPNSAPAASMSRHSRGPPRAVVSHTGDDY